MRMLQLRVAPSELGLRDYNWTQTMWPSPSATPLTALLTAQTPGAQSHSPKPHRTYIV